MFNDNRPEFFSEILNKAKEQNPNNMELQIRNNASLPHNEEESRKKERRRQLGSTGWEIELSEEVLLKGQSTSDTAWGITAKFMREIPKDRG